MQDGSTHGCTRRRLKSRRLELQSSICTNEYLHLRTFAPLNIFTPGHLHHRIFAPTNIYSQKYLQLYTWDLQPHIYQNEFAPKDICAKRYLHPKIFSPQEIFSSSKVVEVLKGIVKESKSPAIQNTNLLTWAGICFHSIVIYITVNRYGINENDSWLGQWRTKGSKAIGSNPVWPLVFLYGKVENWELGTLNSLAHAKWNLVENVIP